MQPVQCKMARVAIGRGVRELARAADVSPDMIARLERGDAIWERTVAIIRGTLESAGRRSSTNGDAPGVRLRKG